MSENQPEARQHRPVTPPAMVGLVGGGPMSRYLATAARQMGYRIGVLDPDAEAPAMPIADLSIVAPLDDPDALRRLAEACDVVTVEAEDAPHAALRGILDSCAVRPSPDVISMCRDRIEQRTFLDDLGVPLAPWRPLRTEEDLEAAASLDFPAILKPAVAGPDSPGHVSVPNRSRLAEMWDSIGRIPCVLERRMRVFKELAVGVARSADGRTACTPIAQCLYIKGVLDATHAPAALPPNGQEGIEDLVGYIAEELGCVGLLSVELFIVGRAVIVNEITPVPHRAQLLTVDACASSQFDQQVRAVCGVGLGMSAMRAPGAASVSLSTSLWADGEPAWATVLDEPAAQLHLYPRRPVAGSGIAGHITVVSKSPTAAVSKARIARNQIVPKRPL
ncbi:MAG: phosphoribosylaminoimidazole carboxylase ATPase subunit [Actinomycetota bacterium]